MNPAHIPVDHLQRIGIVVAHLEAAVCAYAEVYGIDRWEITNVDDRSLRSSAAHGRPVEHTYRVARGENPARTLRFELVEPGRGESSFREFLATKGPGVHHLQLLTTDAHGYSTVDSFFRSHGIGLAQADDFDGGSRRRWYDTRAALGGYLLEVAVLPDPDAPDALAVDDVWDLASTYRRPGGRGPLEVFGVQHLGVVVADVMASIGRYSSLYGLHSWAMVNWHSEPGWLESPTYGGAPVEHAYFCGMAFDFHDFGFELIQPTFGPSHYKEDFLALRGEGVHHMNLVFLRDDEHWQELEAWMGTMGVPVVMSGGLRNGAGVFYYLDTRAKLGGYVIECFGVNPGHGPESFAPDFTIDLSTAASA